MSEHYTAWVTNDTSCLEGEFIDLVVLADDICGYETDQNGLETDTPVWTSVGDPLMRAETTVSAREESGADTAMAQAIDLLAAAGWEKAGDWQAVTTGYTVAVQRS
ncbi:hypothetical protein [Streptomyces axinellae]|uniref:Uncharacterized protein n=1 Tax=Streptomyces axinellae TaxID=552788 RepID=A0ABP6DDE9_9ACTN